MRIYVAAEYGRMEEARALADDLIADGHVVTSSWLGGGHSFSQSSADLDLLDVDRSEALVVITNPLGTQVTGGGRWFEAGYAYGRGKRVICVGEAETVFCHLRQVEVCPDVASARKLLLHD